MHVPRPPTVEETAADWLRDGHRFVVATLVERFGSAPPTIQSSTSRP